MIILDTDVLTLVQRGSGTAYENVVARLDESGETRIWVTVISIEEQMRGWMAVIARASGGELLTRSYARLEALVQEFAARDVLPFDGVAEEHFQRLRKQRVRIGTMDLRIASVALAHDAILISRNVAHFRKVTRLRVEDWTV